MATSASGIPAARAFRAVLFDIDGTLVDSNDAHARAWHAVFARHGQDVSLAEARVAIGKGGDKLLADLAGIDEQSDEGKAMAEERKAFFRERFIPHLRPFPRARDLVQRLIADGFRLGVATSASEDEVSALLRIARVDDLLPVRVSADDVGRSKPDPDIVVAALEAVGADPAEAVLIGDTPYDVAAAQRAGVAALGVESGGWRAEDLAPAIAVYRDVADLLARFDASPLASAARARRAG